MKDTVSATTHTAASELVVVLLATFNGSRYLRQQLDSIAAQSHLNWQLIVADDGSRDDTVVIVQAFADQNPGRVRLISDSAVGSARDNFFRLLRVAGPAPYFAFCDQDDIWRCDKLERLVHQCQQLQSQNPYQPCLVFSDLAVVDSELAILHPSFMGQVRARPHDITHKTLLTENAVPGCAMLFNAALADVFRSHEFDSAEAIMHDWWIALLASTIGRISYVPIPLVSYRQHATNILGSVNRSGLAFIFSKMVRGDRSPTLETYRQAAQLLTAYGDHIQPTVYAEIDAFASLAHRRKYSRIWLILKHRTLKQTFARRAYQLLRA